MIRETPPVRISLVDNVSFGTYLHKVHLGFKESGGVVIGETWKIETPTDTLQKSGSLDAQETISHHE